MEEDKNLEQNLDNSNEKLHISDVMCCFCGKSHKKLNLDNVKSFHESICEDCYDNGYHNYDFREWLIIERMVVK